MNNVTTFAVGTSHWGEIPDMHTCQVTHGNGRSTVMKLPGYALAGKVEILSPEKLVDSNGVIEKCKMLELKILGSKHGFVSFEVRTLSGTQIVHEPASSVLARVEFFGRSNVEGVEKLEG